MCIRDSNGEVWPLPQTGQMWLEYELLSNPEAPGFFCVSTSYRQEPNPVEGRHEVIFPMFEFEMHGGVDDLKEMELELCEHLGIPLEIDSIQTYDDWTNQFNTCLLYTSPSPRDVEESRMPSSA